MVAKEITTYMRSEIVHSRFEELVGERAARSYISSVLLAVANDPGAFEKCTPESVYLSALRAATLHLSVEPATGQAYIVPFKDRATLIVGYKGLHDMAVRTGRYRYINVGPVFEGEIVEENRISGFHSLKGGRKSDKVIGWLGAFELYTGYGHTLYMTVQEIHQHAQKYSKSYSYEKSGWKTDTAKMERKTVLRLLLRRWGYLDPNDAAALDEIEGHNNQEVEAEFINEEEVAACYLPDAPAAPNSQSAGSTPREERML